MTLLSSERVREIATQLWEIHEQTGFSIKQLSRVANMTSDTTMRNLLDLPAGANYMIAAHNLQRIMKLFKQWDKRKRVNHDS